METELNLKATCAIDQKKCFDVNDWLIDWKVAGSLYLTKTEEFFSVSY